MCALLRRPFCLIALLCPLLSVLFWAGQVQGQNADQVLARLKNLCAGIESLSCDFSQQTNIPLFAVPVTARGRLVFKKPDRLIWEYQSPMREGLVLNGASGHRWQDTPSHRTDFATDRDNTARFIAAQMLSWIQFEPKRLAAAYSIESEGDLALRLTPLKAETSAVLTSLHIVFYENGVAQSVNLSEAGGGTTLIRFSNIVLNRPIADEEFR